MEISAIMAFATLSVLPDPNQEPYDWSTWLTTNGPRLLLFARQQTRNQEDAEDVLQDALVRLVEKLRNEEFVGDESAWLPYIYTSIRRLAIDLGRKDDRRHRREDLVSTDTIQAEKEDFHPWFEGDASDEEDRILLERALKNLPDKFREVLTMKIWGELTFAEIGEALEISQNTAASRYRYGLEALKRALLGARNRGDLSI